MRKSRSKNEMSKKPSSSYEYHKYVSSAFFLYSFIRLIASHTHNRIASEWIAYTVLRVFANVCLSMYTNGVHVVYRVVTSLENRVYRCCCFYSHYSSAEVRLTFSFRLTIFHIWQILNHLVCSSYQKPNKILRIFSFRHWIFTNEFLLFFLSYLICLDISI